MESHPWPLFHYTTADTALDHILAQGTMRFGPPGQLNDPFESEPYYVNVVGEGGLSTDPDERRESFEQTENIFERASDLLRNRCRLLCLTEARRNPSSSLAAFGDGFARARMWSQYAGNHTGVCLAFDRAMLCQAVQEMANARRLKLYEGPVRYAREPSAHVGPFGDLRPGPFDVPLSRSPDLDLFIEERFPTAVHDLYFVKAWDWSSETEYRCLVHGDVDEFEFVDITPAVSGIFLGSRFPTARLADLRARCPELWERTYQVWWRNGFAVPLQCSAGATLPSPSWAVPPFPAIDPDTAAENA